ncbi:MAG TPA: hypothetical protein VJ814_00505 [Gaiellaceae bacterium]|nr:hypothetical protein [Gaiellaceae bacterium]
MPAGRLTDLFLGLGDDEALLAEYARDPAAVLAAHGIDAAAARAAAEGDLEAVRALIADENRAEPRYRFEPAPR